MKIEYDQEPSGKCPVQAEGRLNGLPFYFRSRGGSWALHVASTPEGDALDDDAWFHREEYKGRHAHRDDEINDGRRYAAGWADEDECMDFIQRAALLHPSNQPTP